MIDPSQFTYATFADHILKYIEGLATRSSVLRLDIVADTYQKYSIKGTRGTEAKVVFQESDKLPNNLTSFLGNDDNKTCLNKVIVQHPANPLFWSNSLNEVVISYGEKIWTKTDGYKEIVQPWVDFGSGTYRRNISINESFEFIEDSLSLALPFFHAFTGCDSTCSFYNKTKAVWFNHWMSYQYMDDVTTAFQQLSWLPESATVTAHMNTIEQFVVAAFAPRAGAVKDINQIRYQMFTDSISGSLRDLPPSRSALEMHVLRSSFQSGWVWGNTISARTPPPVDEWEWVLDVEQERLQIKWTESDGVPSVALADLVKTCKCKSSTALCVSCSCGKRKFKCLKYCNCKLICTRTIYDV